jgi:hypothetical protein
VTSAGGGTREATDRPLADDLAGAGKEEAERDHVLRVRLGHGANCSSVGSVVDTLFATAVVGAAAFAAVLAALKREDARVAGQRSASTAASQGAQAGGEIAKKGAP